MGICGKHFLKALLCSGALALASQVQSAATYTIQDLGIGWQPTGINDSGTIIGNTFASSVAQWLGNGCSLNCFSVIGDFGNGSATATGINNLGQFVGTYRTAGNAFHAYRYDSNGLLDLGTLGGSHSEASAINNFGQVTGQSYLMNGSYSAFLYGGSSMEDIGTPQGLWNSSGTSINDAGAVLGWSNPQFGYASQAFTLTAGGNLSVIVPITGYEAIAPTDINGSGQAVGYSFNGIGAGPAPGFTIENGVRKDISDPYLFQAFSNNDSGQIVGYASNGTQTGLYLRQGEQGSFWGDLVGEEAGWNLGSATGAFHINNAGQIVGVGNFNGEQHAFLMTPTNRVDATAPTDAQLAQMSVNSYSKETSPNVGTFALIPQTYTGTRDSEERVYAEAYLAEGLNGGRDQVVISIRGSRLLDFELRNGTFLTGKPTEAFQQSADDIAILVRRLRSEYGNADFTFTGHSLGGAFGQALGEAIDVNAIVFDAPGAKGVFDLDARNRLAQLANGNNGPTFSQTKESRNIRFYGDDVSKIGNHYDDRETLIPQDPETFNKIAYLQEFTGSCYFKCHDKFLILDELNMGTIPIDGISDVYKELRLPIQGFVDALKTIKLFDERVNPSDFWLYDPIGIEGYIQIDMLDSDVNLSEIYLPGFFDDFEIFTLQNGSWISLGKFEGFSRIDVPVSEAYRINGLSELTDEYGNFGIGLRFAAQGNFRGSISVISSMVPEPATWSMLLIGFLVAGQWIRQHNHKIYQSI